MYKIRKFLENPFLLFAKLIEKTASWYSDEKYLKLQYLFRFHKTLDLKNPTTFNEKLQWLKLFDRNPQYVGMVDKFEAKQYVANVIGQKYIIPTLGVYNTVDEIDFDKLPNQFVLKCTHDSGGIVICKDKTNFNIEKAKRELKRGLLLNYYPVTREWPYLNVKPRIIAEKYMSDNDDDLSDYKVHNFNGIPRVILVCRDRFSKNGLTEDFYSEKWEHLNMRRPDHPNAVEIINKPESLSELLDLSSKLSQNIPFLRTDFYIINGKIYFGELTFYPSSGLAKFVPNKWDDVLGNWLVLP